jgi:hypothetical protein
MNWATPRPSEGLTLLRRAQELGLCSKEGKSGRDRPTITEHGGQINPLHSPAPRLNLSNSGRVHLGRAKKHALAESVSVAEYFDIEAHPLTKTHDLHVGVRDNGLDAVTQTQFANGYQKIGGDLDLRASRIVADAKTGAFPDGGGAQRCGTRNRVRERLLRERWPGRRQQTQASTHSGAICIDDIDRHSRNISSSK